tara:strand:+ start:237 stop:509 length:273 start_codon:yes stop_codon:yes gene_type:complete
MNTLTKTTLAFFFGLALIMFYFSEAVQADFDSIYSEKSYNQNLGTQNNSKDIDIDDLLGSDLDFPFRSENHRDNSNPIGRIAPISKNNVD